jgi:hypothetical protein
LPTYDNFSRFRLFYEAKNALYFMVSSHVVVREKIPMEKRRKEKKEEEK